MNDPFKGAATRVKREMKAMRQALLGPDEAPPPAGQPAPPELDFAAAENDYLKQYEGLTAHEQRLVKQAYHDGLLDAAGRQQPLAALPSEAAAEGGADHAEAKLVYVKELRTLLREPVAAHIAALSARLEQARAALQRLINEMDDEVRVLEPTCNECTQGQTPIRFDKGLCSYHQMLAALAAASQEAPQADSPLEQALDRIQDMLKGDDGQAWKEAERFLRRYRRNAE